MSEEQADSTNDAAKAIVADFAVPRCFFVVLESVLMAIST